jgi:hypothetical protein
MRGKNRLKPVISTTTCNMNQIFRTSLIYGHARRAEMCFMRRTGATKMTEIHI